MATVDRTREARVREDPEDQAVRAAREAKAKEKAKEDQAVREAREAKARVKEDQAAAAREAKERAKEATALKV